LAVEDLRVDALAVEEGETGRRVVHRGVDVVEGVGDRRRHDAVVAGHRVEARGAEPLAAGHPDVLTVDALDVGDVVVAARREPGGPGVGRLGEVGVDVDDPEPVEQVSGHRISWGAGRADGCDVQIRIVRDPRAAFAATVRDENLVVGSG
jgi:hypothetical protein